MMQTSVRMLSRNCDCDGVFAVAIQIDVLACESSLIIISDCQLPIADLRETDPTLPRYGIDPILAPQQAAKTGIIIISDCQLPIANCVRRTRRYRVTVLTRS